MRNNNNIPMYAMHVISVLFHAPYIFRNKKNVYAV